ncbi:MAG: hypothetical protein HS128_16905 [Ideonella sp.]|nr:hypothetical protein [Ideonella sp.]MCC7456977.1 hypothetical protein [Nitrospira sp.]
MPRPPSAQRAAVSAAAAAAATPDRQARQAAPEGRSWLGETVRALFVRDLRVHRIDGKLAVALEDKPAARAAAASPMRAELKALLDAAPDSRLQLRFLAAVEHGLKHKDPTGLFLFEVAPERLRTVLRQFDALVPAAPAPALAALRARIVDAINSREKKQQQLEMSAPRSDLMRDHRVEVAEARPSDFDRIQQQWKDRVTG